MFQESVFFQKNTMMHISLKSILFGLLFHVLRAKDIDELMLPYKMGPFKVREVSYGGIFNLELDQHYIKVWVPDVPGTFPVVYHLTGLAGLNNVLKLPIIFCRTLLFLIIMIFEMLLH